jgi:hypothetical protein
MPRTTPTPPTAPASDPARAAADRRRWIAGGVDVAAIVVRIAGEVPTRLDLTHAGDTEQQLGMTVGQVLLYLRTATTAEAVWRGWRQAGALAAQLPPARPGQRLMTVGPSTACVMVRVAGSPKMLTALQPGRAAAARTPEVPSTLRMTIGPLQWEVCDRTAYATMLNAWQRAAVLLGSTTIHNDA